MFGRFKTPNKSMNTMQNQTPSTYKFRAECATDAQVVRAVLLPWLLHWSEQRENLEYEGVEYPAPDVDVEFSVLPSGPSLNEIRWLLDGIDNCHVAAESIEHVTQYTGERASRRSFTAPTELPSATTLSQSIAAARVRLQVLQHEMERVQGFIATAGVALRQGKRWEAPAPDAPAPGWLVPVPGPTAGLTAIRRISAPAGCKKWQAKGDLIVKARLTTIDA